jgi:hypothetical protein
MKMLIRSLLHTDLSTNATGQAINHKSPQNRPKCLMVVIRLDLNKPTEFAPFDENSNISPDSTRAKSDSVGPIENVSEDFSKMNRGQDVITESERIKKLEQRLTESDAERDIFRREIYGLKNEVKVLKEKTTPELFKELNEKSYDRPGSRR